ncbi:MAG TPA: regulatory protein RecX [Thermotogota bacterium]|nr:regulatory protein RecX [Thermotogota bacterium]HRW91429.1 regulatory protein RecX [Thermotogota bacterium]
MSPGLGIERYVSLLFKHRIRCEAEIRERCAQKGFDEEEIEELVRTMKENGLIDDLRFCMLYAEDAFRLKTKGPRLVEQELRQLGVTPETIGVALESVQKDVDLEEILRAHRKKQENIAEQKWIQRMIRRGFPWQTIQQALK